MELLILLDAATETTRDVANASTYQHTRVVEVLNRDLGLSRNDAARAATGTYLCFLDGDDLISKEWLIKCLEYYSHVDDARTVLHTEYMVGIHDENWLRYQIESDNPDFSAMELSQNWFFCNNSFAPRSLYRDFPFVRSRRSEGLGAEDWKWAADSIACGVRHHYVPGTAYYYRRQHRRASLGHESGMQVMPSILFEPQNAHLWGARNYLQFFSPASIESAAAGQEEDPRNLIEKMYTEVLSGGDVGNLPSRSGHIRYRHPPVPEWLFEDWRAQHDVDRRVNPTRERSADLVLFHPQVATREGLAMMLLLHQIPMRPVAIMLAPFYRHGGGEKMVIAYLNALCRLCPTEEVVLLRLREDDVDFSQIDPRVRVIELGKLLANLDIQSEEAVHTVMRIILERSPRIFWTVNNDLGLDAIESYGRPIGSTCTRATSVFGPGLTPEGYAGYAVTKVPTAADNLDVIVGDNAAILSLLREMYGVEEEKLVFCPAPALSPFREMTVREPAKLPFQVLWYSRLDFEKRADLLLKIADQFDPSEIQIIAYGEAVVSDHHGDVAGLFRAHPAIDYRGPFSQLSDLAKEEFDAYLYTSSSDGFPFVILEAAAMGLPIVASSVGGVGEVVTPSTGYPISEIDDPIAYAAQIKAIKSDPHEAFRRSVALKKWLESNRTSADFDAAVQSVLDVSAPFRPARAVPA